LKEIKTYSRGQELATAVVTTMSDTQGTCCEADSLAPSPHSNSNENVCSEGAELEASRQERDLTVDTKDDLTEEGVQQEGMHQEEVQQDNGRDCNSRDELHAEDPDFATQGTTTHEHVTVIQTTCSHEEEEEEEREQQQHQQRQQMDRVRRKTPPPTTWIHRTVSQYEKDPLNIGVPFPVLRRAPPPFASAPAAAADDDELSEGEGYDSNRVGRDEFRRAGIHAERKVAVDTTGLKLPSRVPSLPNAEGGLGGIDKSSYDASTGQSYSMEGEDDLSVMEATLQESLGMPGSFAVRGPGVTDDDLRSSVNLEYLEETTATDLEEGFSAVELPGNVRSASQCSNTTSTFHLSTSSAASDSSYLVEATLVSDDDDKDDDDVVQAEKAEGQLRFSAVCVVGSFCVMAVIIVGAMLGIAAVFKLEAGDFEQKTSENHGPGPVRAPAVPPSVPTLSPTFTVRDTVAKVPTLQRVKETGKLRCGVEEEGQAFLEYFANVQMGQNTTNSTSDTNSGEVVPVSRFSHYYVSLVGLSRAVFSRYIGACR
jgi:hypothetical protein